MKLEIIKCFDDGSWDTEVVDIPDEELYLNDEMNVSEAEAHILNIVQVTQLGLTKNRDVVYIGVYNWDPEEGEDNG